MALRLKASFHASPVAIIVLLAKHRRHQSKNIASLKNNISMVGLMASKSFENTVENLSILCE